MKTPDPFAYHEATDRALMIEEMLHTFLMEHQVVRYHPKMEEACEKAAQALFHVVGIASKLETKHS